MTTVYHAGALAHEADGAGRWNVPPLLPLPLGCGHVWGRSSALQGRGTSEQARQTGKGKDGEKHDRKMPEVDMVDHDQGRAGWH